MAPRTHEEYNLSLAAKGKSLFVNKGAKSRKLFFPLLIIPVTLSTLSSILPFRCKTFHSFKRLVVYSRR